MVIRFVKLTASAMSLALLVAGATATGAVTTLRFEARVDSTWGHWAANAEPTSLPFVLNTGDTIFGSITFDPNAIFGATNEYTQPYEIRVSVGGFDLTTDQFTAYVMDDRRDAQVICDCSYAGPVAPDPIVHSGDAGADPSLPPIDDRIQITRFLGIGDPPAMRLPGFPEWRWQPAFDLIGPLTVLNRDSYLPGSAASWNSFTQRRFYFGIDRHGYQDFAAVSATITSISRLPEPSAGILAMTLVLGVDRRLTTRNKRTGDLQKTCDTLEPR